MSIWKHFDGSSDDWDEAISNINNSTYLHYSSWAQYLNHQGWETIRLETRSRTPLGKSFLQGFVKFYFSKVAIFWFPDWIIGDYSLTEDCLKFIREKYRGNIIYIRFRSHRKSNFSYDIAANSLFKKAIIQIDTAKTMWLDLTESEEGLLAKLSKNWKRNLKRSQRTTYSISKITEYKLIAKIYREFSELKNLNNLFSENDIKNLMKIYGDNLVVFGIEIDKEIHAIRGVVINKRQATDIFAASNSFARKNYFSYRLLWELITFCKNSNCDVYDLNGVDPQKNQGVYNFKKGVGSSMVETLGEFEFSNSFIIKFCINLYIKFFY